MSKDSKQRRNVKLENKNLTRGAATALSSLTDIFHGMTVADILKAIEVISAECGKNAIITLDYDNINGYHYSDILWWRPETDEEWKKRLQKNVRISKATATKHKENAKKKVEKEKADLARLKAKYPDLA